MARPLVKDDIKRRMSISAKVMKVSKQIVKDSVSINGKVHVPPPLAREALSNYLKAQKAFNSDSLKLKLIEDQKDA